ncbi:hypothetical protein PF008_g32159 [Phytophthora fragariae]|uniref:Uncharacterized protein n=1 Tax=Phytophthora fragariae TaxID=53985 RepID=A0A6G0Q0K5_9STRA|nr:hypothetical protein PF008_g32159 [Phytophthora fragariae]
MTGVMPPPPPDPTELGESPDRKNTFWGEPEGDQQVIRALTSAINSLNTVTSSTKDSWADLTESTEAEDSFMVESSEDRQVIGSLKRAISSLDSVISSRGGASAGRAVFTKTEDTSEGRQVVESLVRAISSLNSVIMLRGGATTDTPSRCLTEGEYTDRVPDMGFEHEFHDSSPDNEQPTSNAHMEYMEIQLGRGLGE